MHSVEQLGRSLLQTILFVGPFDPANLVAIALGTVAASITIGVTRQKECELCPR